jgi:hypothetical protein
VLHEGTPEGQFLTSYLATAGPFTRKWEKLLPRNSQAVWLTPIGNWAGHMVFGLWHRTLMQLFADDLLSTGEIAVPESADHIGAGLLLPAAPGCQTPSWLLFAGDRLWLSAANGTPKEVPGTLGWRPGWPHPTLLSPAPLVWRFSGPNELELCGLDHQEGAHWASLYSIVYHTPWNTDSGQPIQRAVAGQTGYLAVAFIGPGRLAAVRRTGVDWLRRQGHQLVLTWSTALGLEAAVACFHSPLTNELLVVCRDGWLVRLPVPH